MRLERRSQYTVKWAWKGHIHIIGVGEGSSRCYRAEKRRYSKSVGMGLLRLKRGSESLTSTNFLSFLLLKLVGLADNCYMHHVGGFFQGDAYAEVDKEYQTGTWKLLPGWYIHPLPRMKPA